MDIKKIALDFFKLIKTTFDEWNADGAPRLAAALAYYTAFSIAPLLVIIIGIVGIVVSENTVRTEVIANVQAALGNDAASLVRDLIDNVNQPAEGIVSTLLGVVALLLGAAGAFGNMQVALDIIWNVDTTKTPTGIIATIRDKFLSFGMLIFAGFLLLVSMVVSTVVSVMYSYFLTQLPGAEFLLQIITFIISFAVITLLFAMIYKFLPHTVVHWGDVWVGAAVTSLLFSIGKTLLGLYLARSSPASAYGAAGAFVLVLLWIYYSAQIVLFGAEFTQVYSRFYGSRAKEDAAAKLLGTPKPLPVAGETGLILPPAGDTPATPATPPELQGKRAGVIPTLLVSGSVLVLGFLASLWGARSNTEATS